MVLLFSELKIQNDAQFYKEPALFGVRSSQNDAVLPEVATIFFEFSFNLSPGFISWVAFFEIRCELFQHNSFQPFFLKIKES